MKFNKADDTEGAVSWRLAAFLTAAFLLPILIYAAGPGPQWWTDRHVVSGTTLSGTADYAGANQGQLKNIATAAFQELSANLPGGVGYMTAPSGSFPGGTGWQLTNLINGWSTTTSGTLVAVTGSNTNDYGPVNLGQLKNVASLFYNRLIEVGYAGDYPWLSSTNTPNDYAAANIGQVKNLFSIDVTYDSDSNGLPDWWEMLWFGAIGQSGTAAVPSGSGLTILQAYQQGVSPFDYYKGISPTLTIVSGTNQTGTSGVFLPAPLVVQVTGTSGAPMVNAPVLFSVTQGAGMLAPDASGTSQSASYLEIRTGTDGNAQICFQQPLVASYTSTIAANAEISEVDFSATTLSDTNAPAAPSDVSAAVQYDGSVVVTWSDNSDNETGFTIFRSDDGGVTWPTVVATVDADVTSYMIPANACVIPGDTMIMIQSNGGGGTATTTIPWSIPKISYVGIDISGTNANLIISATSGATATSGTASSGTMSTTTSGTTTMVVTIVSGTTTTITTVVSVPNDVTSMVLGDNNQVAYAFVSGTYTTPPTPDNHTTTSGTNIISINTWYSGTTSAGAVKSGGYTLISGTTTTSGTLFIDGTTPFVSGTIGSDPLYTGTQTNITADGATFNGFRDESLMAGSNSFESYHLSFPSTYFPDDPYALSNPANTLLLTPQGQAYGNVQENIYFGWDSAPPRDDPKATIYNGFHWSPSQPKQILDFTDPSFTTSLTNLFTNNSSPFFILGAEVFGQDGQTIVACSANGYCGLGTFGTPDPILSYLSGHSIYQTSGLFGASYIVSGTKVEIFYKPLAGNNGTITNSGSTSPTTSIQIGGTASSYVVSCTATPFLPIAMNDSGYVIGTGSAGASLWNGSALVSLGTNSESIALNNQNMIIGYTISGTTTTGMLWLANSGTVSQSITMQSLVAVTGTANNSNIRGVMPMAISGTDGSNKVSILCSGSVMEGSGSAAALTFEMLRIRVNATTPSGTATPPEIVVVKLPPGVNFQNLNQLSINSNRIISGLGSIGSQQKALILIPANYRPLADEADISGLSGFDEYTIPHWLMVPEYGSNYAKAHTPANSSFTMTFAAQSTDPGAGITVSPSSTGTSPETITVGAGLTSGSASQIAAGVPGSIGIGGELHLDVKQYKHVTVGVHEIIQKSGTNPAVHAENVPSAGDLQAYLNQVYGAQTNTYFTVVREGYTLNYDPTNKGVAIIDETNRTGGFQMGMIRSIGRHTNTKYDFNLYYVHKVSTAGDSTGYSFKDFNDTIIGANSGSIINMVAAHEIGHLLGLMHPEDVNSGAQYDPSSPWNNLMHHNVNGTLLVQPQWDIINPYSPP